MASIEHFSGDEGCTGYLAVPDYLASRISVSLTEQPDRVCWRGGQGQWTASINYRPVWCLCTV